MTVLRRLFQFSLRRLLILMLGVTVLLGIWVISVQPYREQARAIKRLMELDGAVEIQPSQGPSWQRWLVETIVGQDTFVDATKLDLTNAKVDEDAFDLIRSMPRLESLNADRVVVDVRSLQAIASCQQLSELSLRYTSFNDETMRIVRQLTNLEELHLTGTNVSDESLDELKEMTNLRALYVRWTDVSSAGAERLCDSLPNCHVHY